MSWANFPRPVPIVLAPPSAPPARLQTTVERLAGTDNVALDTIVSASSEQEGQTAVAAIDSVARGFPEKPQAEWPSAGEKTGATLNLKWKVSQTVDRVQLFDRPNQDGKVTAGLLSFSDGSTANVGALAPFGTMVRFPAKTITSLSFKVTAVSPQTQNVGLFEIAVFWARSERGTVYGADNVAESATVSASSSQEEQPLESAIDSRVSGFPDEPGAEWVSNGEREGVTLLLT